MKKKASKEYKEEIDFDQKLSVNWINEEKADKAYSINRADKKSKSKNSISVDALLQQKKGKKIAAKDAVQQYHLNQLSKDQNKSTLKEVDEQEVKAVQDAIKIAENYDNKTLNGKNIPKAKAARDPKMDKEPIDEEDLGLPEDHFLVSREVNKLDLVLQMKAQKDGFLGSNVRRIRDFLSIFEKGMSSKADPKLDLSYAIHHNPDFKKELISKQLLRNFHSRETLEVFNTRSIFKDLKLSNELMDEIKNDSKAFENEKLIEKIKERLPNA